MSLVGALQAAEGVTTELITRLLNDDKSDNISISVSNDDIVILINNLDISNNIEFSKMKI